jgi:hypothetical protein
LIQTTYGLLDPNPTPGQPTLPRNFGRGPGAFSVNLRVTKTFEFGSGSEAPSAQLPRSSGGTGGGGALQVPTASAGRRYTMLVSMSMRNLLNHNNPGPIIGNITSPLFGFANQQAGAGGTGFSESANNRRFELQMRFIF